MNSRRLIIGVGTLLLLAGVVGMLLPVSVPNGSNGSDVKGTSLSCGNGVARDLTAARAANDRNGASLPILGQMVPHTDFVVQCESALSDRRAWAIPLTLVGIVGIGAPLLARRAASTST